MTATLDARERALAAKQQADRGASFPDLIERVAAAHSSRQPVVDDRFRIGPTSTPTASIADDDTGWPRLGLGVVLGVVFAAALGLAAWGSSRRPYAH